jgi:hypothetical protein
VTELSIRRYELASASLGGKLYFGGGNGGERNFNPLAGTFKCCFCFAGLFVCFCDFFPFIFASTPLQTLNPTTSDLRVFLGMSHLSFLTKLKHFEMLCKPLPFVFRHAR